MKFLDKNIERIFPYAYWAFVAVVVITVIYISYNFKQ